MNNIEILSTTINKYVEQSIGACLTEEPFGWLHSFEKIAMFRSSEAQAVKNRSFARERMSLPKFHSYKGKKSERRCVYQLVTTECRKIKTIDETLSSRVEFARQSSPSSIPFNFQVDSIENDSIGYIRDTDIRFTPKLLFRQTLFAWHLSPPLAKSFVRTRKWRDFTRFQLVSIDYFGFSSYIFYINIYHAFIKKVFEVLSKTFSFY